MFPSESKYNCASLETEVARQHEAVGGAKPSALQYTCNDICLKCEHTHLKMAHTAATPVIKRWFSVSKGLMQIILKSL